MDEEECNICGRKCDGVHNNKIISKEKEIQRITKLLESYGEKMVDEIISQIYENRRLKCEKV
jgi:F0F1-type ATP synthase delta subunit